MIMIICNTQLVCHYVSTLLILINDPALINVPPNGVWMFLHVFHQFLKGDNFHELEFAFLQDLALPNGVYLL